VATLDALIADDLLFTNHLGAVFSKEMDLAAHRSGRQRLHRLEPSEQRVKSHGDTAIVSVKISLAGKFDGLPFAGDFRYTRVWQLYEGTWQITAGHFSPSVPEN
jgi:ketosteroid isomerase-like protein